MHRLLLVLAVATTLSACGAKRNPPRPLTVPEVLLAPRAASSTASVPDPAPVAPPAAEEPAAGEASERSAPPAGTILGRVAGEDLDAGELLALWMLREPETGRDVIEQLVVSRLAVLEARRLGLRLDPALLESAFTAGVERRNRDVRERSDFESLEEYLDSRGIHPEDYLAQHREQTATALITERAVRAWTLGQERILARAVIVRDDAGVAEVRAALAAGEPFAAVAERLSLEKSRERGGLLPPIVRSDLPLARLAFQTPTGEVGGPLDALGGKLLLLVEERRPPLEGDWAAVAGAVEESLAAEPVDPYFELEQWRGAMQRRYEVDLRPLSGVVGLRMR